MRPQGIFRISSNVQKQQTGDALTECVATCPANFKDDNKKALLEAFELNGIKVLKIVPEPTAAGYAYAYQKSGQPLVIIVFDFGGGDD